MTSEDPHIERIRQLDADFEAGNIDRATYDVERQRALQAAAEADAEAKTNADSAKVADLTMKGCGGLLALAILIAVTLFIFSRCSSGSPEASPTPTASASALQMMEVAFKGNPSQSEIKALLDPAMTAAGLPITEDNYQRAGSVVIALGQKNNIAEMSILRCIPQRTDDTRIQDHDFPSLAAVCAVDIIEGVFKE